ncbi:MAG: hypothetical protein BRD49_01580 [Bacteroidetes bacterium SW_10_40_5]|nr:MAG: hypothetical protein BRD49_01580 [Bacteroidetes bacterium SW_10_40_5]
MDSRVVQYRLLGFGRLRYFINWLLMVFIFNSFLQIVPRKASILSILMAVSPSWIKCLAAFSGCTSFFQSFFRQRYSLPSSNSKMVKRVKD